MPSFSDQAPAQPQPLLSHFFSIHSPTHHFYTPMIAKYLTPLSIPVEIKKGFSTSVMPPGLFPEHSCYVAIKSEGKKLHI